MEGYDESLINCPINTIIYLASTVYWQAKTANKPWSLYFDQVSNPAVFFYNCKLKKIASKTFMWRWINQHDTSVYELS